MAYPRYRKARSHKFVNYVGGDISVATGPTWHVLPLSLAIRADIGDTICATLSGCHAGTHELAVDIATYVSAAPLHFFSGGCDFGLTQPAGVAPGFCAVGFYDVVSGDVVTGKVTVVPYAAGEGGGTTIFASLAQNSLVFAIENLGPQAPH